MRRRFLAAALGISMAVAMTPAAAFAEETSTEEATEVVSEVASEDETGAEEESSEAETKAFDYSEGYDEKGFFEGVKALDYVTLLDYMVGGWNFGCGSSREHAPLAIKTAGISVVIAKSFARIFYRNSINIGLPIMECPEAVDAISAGDTVSVNFDTGVITDETTGKTFQAEPFPPFIQKIIADGGLMKSLTKK